jgi:hypothetical protein
MEALIDQGLSDQPDFIGNGTVRMPITKHALLGIHSPRPFGNHEAGKISGRGIIGIVQRFRTGMNLTKTDGVHWRVSENESDLELGRVHTNA